MSEALTNASKHAGACSVRVEVRREDGAAVVEVADDGRGGAEAGAGSGLRGLADRIGALGGRLEVESPAWAALQCRASERRLGGAAGVRTVGCRLWAAGWP